MLELDRLEKGLPVPLYYQLKMMLIKAIQKVEFPGNTPLPPEERIAEMCGISRTTVRQAVQELIKEGWLYRVKAKGTFVAHGRIGNSIAEDPEKYGLAVRWNGKNIQSEVLKVLLMPFQEKWAAFQGESVGEYLVYTVKRLSCDGFPAAVFHIYQVRAYGLNAGMHRVHHILRSMEAIEEDRSILGLCGNEPMQEVISTVFNHQDRVLEYTVSRYCGNMCRVELVDKG